MTTATEQITYTEEILMRHDEISPGVFVIGIQRTRPFKAGQSVYLSVNPDDTPRIYSICSGPNEDELCILFSVHPGGLLTPQLARMKKGDRVWISNPYGVFIIGDEPAWLIATGTGIAPFYSALSAGIVANKTLVHGVRYRNQFYFEQTVAPLLPHRYHRCCSMETGEGLFAGRVTAFLQQYPALPTDCSYYICGQARMAVDVRDLLMSRGISAESIKIEFYF